MKKISIALLTLLVSLALISCGGDSSDIKMYVTAKSGLLVRADASTNASKLGLVPYGEAVSVLSQADETMTIGGKTGSWTRVRYNDLEGWAFGGFLSATPVGQASNNQGNTCVQLINCVNKINGCGIVSGCQSADGGQAFAACHEKYQSGCTKQSLKTELSRRCQASLACLDKYPCMAGVDGCPAELEQKATACATKAGATNGCDNAGNMDYPADFYPDYTNRGSI